MEHEEKSKKSLKQYGEMYKNVGMKLGQGTKKAAVLAKQTQETVFSAIDVNGNGEIDIEDIIIMGINLPGIKINREKFLEKEFINKYADNVVNEAILKTPIQAGILEEDIDKIADEIIKFERNCVTGISAALGTPGGLTMAVTIPADIAQYYGYMLRVAQKLLYLYGFPQIELGSDGQPINTETMNVLIICLGTMYGVAGANNAVKCMANALASGVEKKLLNKALTKGAIYPIVKKVASWFGVKMTKQVFAGFFKKAIPVVGGVIGGTITFVAFKPCCDKLKSSLQDTMLSNSKYSVTEEEIIFMQSFNEAE